MSATQARLVKNTSLRRVEPWLEPETLGRVNLMKAGSGHGGAKVVAALLADREKLDK